MAKAKAGAPKKRSDRRGAPKGKFGNTPFVPTDQQKAIVESHAAVGTPYWLIAEELGISEDTLTIHFKGELIRGLPKLNARIGGGIAKQALAGDGPSQRYWMSTRAGWKTTTAVENSGPDGGPIQYETRDHYDFSKLSLEEKREAERLLAKASGEDEPA